MGRVRRSSPGLPYEKCHGDDEPGVLGELYRKASRALPPLTSGRELANTMQTVAWPAPPSDGGDDVWAGLNGRAGVGDDVWAG